MFLFSRSESPSQRTRKPSRKPVSEPVSRQPSPSRLLSRSAGDLDPRRRRKQGDVSRRTSVFSSRQRSDTLTSTFSFNSAASTPVSTEKRWWRGSREKKSGSDAMTARRERSESGARSFLSRSGRMMLKRQNSTLTSLRTLDGAGDDDPWKPQEVEELPGTRYQYHGRTKSIDSKTLRNMPISRPYNFQHLTHANAQQLPEIHRASHNELVTEFSALRASQAPRRELRGIKAENLHFRNFSSVALQQDAPTSAYTDTSTTTTPPLSPTRSIEGVRRESPSPRATMRSSRYARSIENFSLPGPKSPRSPLSPVVPPPRTSSRAAVATYVDPSLVCLESPIAPLFASPQSKAGRLHSDSIDSTSCFSQRGGSISMAGSADYEPLPHAVTTPDDSALQLLPLPFGTPGTELADVPEEDEGYFKKRKSMRNPQPSTALRHAQSLPSFKHPVDVPAAPHQSLPAISKRRSSQQQLVTTGSKPSRPHHGSQNSVSKRRPSGSARRISKHLKGIDGCWEDAIDYCYEHAAEADCDYDWDRRSREGLDTEAVLNSVAQNQVRVLEPIATSVDRKHSDVRTARTDLHTGDNRPLSYGSLDLAVPDLEPSSALSEATSGAGALTPALSVLPSQPVEASMSPTKDAEAFRIGPSLMTALDYEAQEEAMYQEILADCANSDRHYPFYNRLLEEAPESRTDSPISKCNSQESMILSTRATSVQQQHRSTNSSGSLPELVHSKDSRGRFDMVADQLADQLAEHIAALSTAEAVAAPDTQRSISPVYKRRTSLAKEVAHQSMLKKASTNHSSGGSGDFDGAMPFVRQRERSSSEEILKSTATTTSAGVNATSTGPSAPAKRMRSASTATTASGRRSNRVSYNLFPTTGARATS